MYLIYIICSVNYGIVSRKKAQEVIFKQVLFYEFWEFVQKNRLLFPQIPSKIVKKRQKAMFID